MVSVSPTTPAKANVTEVIRSASHITGVSFDYMLRTAQRESSLDPTLKASTSSATGLYQFIDSTWLGMVKEVGPQLGLQAQADAIDKTSSGKYVCSDATQRQKILDLRYDPSINAIMAGAFTQRNQAILSSSLGRSPSEGELYTAHVMGAGGAVRLLEMAKNTPNASAADAFPEAAAANRPLFYHKDGSPRTATETLARIAGKFDTTPAASTSQALLDAQASANQQQADPQANPRAIFARQGNGPVVQSMFRPEGRQVVSHAVQNLWGGRVGALSGSVGTMVASNGPVVSAAPVRPAFYPSTSGAMSGSGTSTRPMMPTTAMPVPVAQPLNLLATGRGTLR